MNCKYYALKNYCDEFYKLYKNECYDQTPYGDCMIIAGILYIQLFPHLEIVGGKCVTKGDGTGPHWWLEYKGNIIDPLGDDWLYPILSREEVNRGSDDLINALKLQENLRSGDKAFAIENIILSINNIKGLHI